MNRLFFISMVMLIGRLVCSSFQIVFQCGFLKCENSCRWVKCLVCYRYRVNVVVCSYIIIVEVMFRFFVFSFGKLSLLLVSMQFIGVSISRLLKLSSMVGNVQCMFLFRQCMQKYRVSVGLFQCIVCRNVVVFGMMFGVMLKVGSNGGIMVRKVNMIRFRFSVSYNVWWNSGLILCLWLVLCSCDIEVVSEMSVLIGISIGSYNNVVLMVIVVRVVVVWWLVIMLLMKEIRLVDIWFSMRGRVSRLVVLIFLLKCGVEVVVDIRCLM